MTWCFSVHDAAEMFGSFTVGRLSTLGVVLHQHLRSVTLALCDAGDVEAGVE